MLQRVIMWVSGEVWGVRLPRTFKSYPLWCGELQELFPQSPVLPLFPLDHDEDDHGEKVEHHQEAGTDPDGQVVSLGETSAVIRPSGSRTAAWIVSILDH